LSEEIEKLKKILLEEYRANGGTKNLTGFDVLMIKNELDHLTETKKLKAEIESLKTNPTEKPSTPIGGIVDKAKENADLARQFAQNTGGLLDYINPPWDERVIFDERYKRDNEVNKLAGEDNEELVVLLRDNEGRLA